MEKQKHISQATAHELLEACKLLYKAWEELLPNLKNGVVQDYELVLTTAPVKATAAIAKAEGEDDVTDLIRCKKCGGTPDPDTDPPMCVDHMAQKGGGNDAETKEE